MNLGVLQACMRAWRAHLAGTSAARLVGETATLAGATVRLSLAAGCCPWVDWATLKGVAYDWSIGYASTVVNTLAGGSGPQHGVVAER
jgi:hypothetical protein